MDNPHFEVSMSLGKTAMKCFHSILYNYGGIEPIN